VRTEHPHLPDLAKIPRPDRRGDPAACFDHGIAPLVSSRGCYANCTFCCIAAWQEQSLPGKRYRLRDVGDVADEMIELQRTRGIDIFVFHDDNFFVPGHKKNRERLSALADALEARKIGHFATVVKARPTDVEPEVFRILKERLHCIRVYIGIETDADQGLKTLRRWSHSKQNHKAIEIVRQLDLYTCFNMLVFDPDTTVE
ncbi:MAG: B12-binding domain-containing radical SAM protein, partial [Polyangiaceae bacterium]